MNHSLKSKEAKMAAELERGGTEVQGSLWGADAEGWALQEERQVPVYAEVLAHAGLSAGASFLDVGCGSGVALREAARLGAHVSGLDAASELAALAATRVPGADVRVGDLQALPFDDGSFDVVTGFNSFQFADDVTTAFAEAARVARPGGRVAVQMWGRPERCELLAVIGAIAPFLPGPPPSPPGGGNYSDPGVLEALARGAGLAPVTTGDIVCTFEYADQAEIVRVVLAAGLTVLAVRLAGEAPVRAAIEQAIVPFRAVSGAYRFVNEWHYLIAAS
jgi:SAM-dependent methyltransferase